VRLLIVVAVLVVAGLSPLAGCDDAPLHVPKKCTDCDGLCAPFRAEACCPVQTYERGKILYVECRCGAERVSVEAPR
jgi:hypothetical protein